MRSVALSPLDILLAVLVPVIWGMGFVAAKAAIADFPPILLMCLRFVVTVLVLVWFVKPPWGWMWPVFWIATIGGALQYAFTFTALTGLDVSTQILIVQAEGPLVAAVAFVMLGERCSRSQVVGMALALAGVVLIAGAPSLRQSLWYVTLAVIGILFWSTGQVLTRKLSADGAKIHPTALIAWVAVFATPEMFGLSLVFEDGQWAALRKAGWVVWGAIAYLGIVMTAIGYSIWYHLLAKHPAGRVAPFLMLIPVTTVAGGVLFLGESLAPQVAVGGLVIIAGVAITLIERPKPSTTEPVEGL